MQARVLLVLSVGLLLAADAKDEVKKEKEKFLGTWKATSMTADGREEKLGEDKSITLEFTADKLFVTLGGKEKKEGTWSVDPSAKPRAFDLVRVVDSVKGKTRKGIYEIAGDNLKICLNDEPDQERPTEFVSKEGSKLVLLVLKKEKN